MRPEAYGERRERETHLSVAQSRYGFDHDIAARLTFLRWLVETERRTEGLPGGRLLQPRRAIRRQVQRWLLERLRINRWCLE
jgi:hypothetical protein